MMAAGTAAESGSDVVLLEGKNRLGLKLGITGKGRCNITNTASLDEFIKNYPNNGRFLYSCLNTFSAARTIDFFNEHGLATKEERGGRVFPESDRALDVVSTLMRYMNGHSVHVEKDSSVLSISKKDGCFHVYTGNEQVFTAEKVIIATGGITYPQTGSTGDGYKFARGMGHKVIDPRPSLIGLRTEKILAGLAGLTLKNITASISFGGKILDSEFGELLFTHTGVSGPVILTLSSRLSDKLAKATDKCWLHINFKPALDNIQLDARMQRDLEKNSKKMLINGMDELLPQSIIPHVIIQTGIPSSRRMHQITREERSLLVDILQDFQLRITGTEDKNEGIVTAGGVNVKEIDPKTMQSKLVDGLFFAGEVLDVDGLTGGYNLQMCFSTGFAAGSAAAKM